MSTDTLLHDLYTLFFSYTQSSLYRSALVSLTTSVRSFLPSSTKQSSSASNTLFVESRLQREYGFYSLSASNANSLSHNALVQLSFLLFVLFLIAIPSLSLLCLSLSLSSSLLVYLTALSTAYVTISTVVYSLVLLQSLSSTGGAQFPLALSSLVYLYFLNIGSFTVLYFTMVQTYDGGKGGRVLEGVSGADGLVNLVHCFYFSVSTFTTVGFGDIHGNITHRSRTPTALPSLCVILLASILLLTVGCVLWVLCVCSRVVGGAAVRVAGVVSVVAVACAGVRQRVGRHCESTHCCCLHRTGRQRRIQRQEGVAGCSCCWCDNVAYIC